MSLERNIFGILTVVSSPYNRPHRPTEDVEVCLYSFCNFGSRLWWVFNAIRQPLYPRERDLLYIEWGIGWAPGSAWTGAENLAPTEIRSRTVQSVVILTVVVSTQ